MNVKTRALAIPAPGILTALLLLLIPARAVAADDNADEDNVEMVEIHHPAELAAALKRHPTQLQLDNALYQWTIEDDLPGAKMLLHAGADVNSQAHSFESSPLELAAFTGDVAMIRMLLERGADPNERGRYGCTPFMMAAIHGNIGALDFLARWRGCKQGLRGDYGDTALHLAIRSRKAATVKFLLAHSSVKKDVKDRDGKTALDVARDALRDAVAFRAADTAEFQQMITLLQ